MFKKLSLGVLSFIILFLMVSSWFGKSESFLINRTVKLMKISSEGTGFCTGEQVRAPSGIDYILTAGHCNGLATKGSIEVVTEDGRHLMRRIIAEDRYSDLLLLEGIPNLRGLDIADSYSPYQHVRTFTHGNAFDTYKTEGYLINLMHLEIPLFGIESQKDEDRCSESPKLKLSRIDFGFFSISVCALSVDEMMSTAKIVPGSSGGMVVDDSGKLVGVASASDNQFSAFVKLSDIHKFVDNY